MNELLILGILLVLFPYVGISFLNCIATGDKQNTDESFKYVVGFCIGQLVFIKLVVILGAFSLINNKGVAFVLIAIFALSLLLDYKRGWDAGIKYLKIIYKFFLNTRSFYSPLGITLALVLGLALTIDLSPPRHADGLRYHLEYSKYIVESGSLPFVPHNQLAIAADAEVLFSVILIGLGSSCVKLAIFTNLLLSILAAYIYFKKVQLNISKYAVYFFITSPVLFLASTIVKPDTLQLLYFIVALLYINKAFIKYNFIDVALAAIFLGEVLALKWTGFIPIASLVCYLIILFLFNAQNRVMLLKLLLLIGFATFIIPLFWYTRNYLATGNPIWPLMNHLFVTDDGSLLYEVSTRKSSRSELIGNSSFLGYLAYTFFIYKPSLLGGIGVSFYLAIPLAFFKTFDKKIIYNLIFLIVYLIFWYFAQASFRHLIWLLPFISILGAYGLLNALSWQRSGLKFIKVFIISSIYFQLLFLLVYSSFFIKSFLGISDIDYFATTPNYHVFKKVEDRLNNPHKKVLAVIPSSELFYLNQLHVDGNSQHSAIIDYKNIKGSSALLKRLQELKIDYILYDHQHIKNDIYIDLRKIIAEHAEIIDNYDSQIITNRLLGDSIKAKLSLVAFNDDLSK